MKDVGIIQGSAAQAVPLVVGADRVDVHTDIVPVTQDHAGTPIEGIFSYHEVQYEKDEYIHMMAMEDGALNAKVDYLGMMTEVF